MVQPLNLNVGRRQFRGSLKGSTQESMARDLQASLSDVLNNMRKVIAGIEEASPEILVEVLKPTFAKSQDLVPVKSGALLNSGYLVSQRVTRGAEVEMGYGKDGVPDYAIYVHEMPYHHEDGKSDKFLERPVLEDYPSFPERLAEGIRSLTGTGVNS